MTLEALVTCQDSVHNSSASVMIWVTKSVDFSWESLHYKVTLVADDTRASISVWRFWRQTVSSWCFKSCYYYRCQLVNSQSRRFISKSSAMRRAKVWLVHPHRFCPTIFLPRFHSLNNRFNPKGERTADVKNADKQLLPCRYPTLRQMARLVLNHTETTNYRYTCIPQIHWVIIIFMADSWPQNEWFSSVCVCVSHPFFFSREQCNKSHTSGRLVAAPLQKFLQEPGEKHDAWCWENVLLGCPTVGILIDFNGFKRHARKW